MDGATTRRAPLYVVQAASTKAPGGIETAVRHYHRMFAANGIGSSVLYRGPAVDALRAEGIDVIELPAVLTGMFRDLAVFSMGVRRETKARGEPALAVVHSDLLLPAVRRICRRAVIAAPCHSDKARRKRGADLAITLNPEQQSRVAAQLGPEARAVELGNPFVPEPRPGPPDRPRAGPPRLVFCARFTAVKEPLTFLRAVARMTRPAEIAMIGDGPLEDEARGLAATLCRPVRFHGWLESPWSEIRDTDILVLPSSWEGLPFLLLEALDRGIAVVASDIAGNRAALGEGAGAALFPPGDDGALADRLDAALADPQALRALAARGRARVEARFGAGAFWRRLAAEALGLDWDAGEPLPARHA